MLDNGIALAESSTVISPFGCNLSATCLPCSRTFLILSNRYYSFFLANRSFFSWAYFSLYIRSFSFFLAIDSYLFRSFSASIFASASLYSYSISSSQSYLSGSSSCVAATAYLWFRRLSSCQISSASLICSWKSLSLSFDVLRAYCLKSPLSFLFYSLYFSLSIFLCFFR